MGSFRYCPNCQCGHGKPSIESDLFEYYREVCKCGETLPQYMSEKEWLVDLSDKIKHLEKMLGVIHNGY